MKDFNDFLEFLENHINETWYDASFVLKEKNDPPNLSAEDMAFVVLAAREGALSVLRQYHTWLKDNLP